MATPLTDKQQRFVDEYLVDLNATQAAIRAGYSAKTARAIGTENLTKPAVAAALSAKQAERAERTQITADRVLQELAVIAFSSVASYELTPGGIGLKDGAPTDAIRAVSSVKVRTTSDEDRSTTTVEYRLWDKNTALTNLGKHLGLFTDKLEVSGESGGPVAIAVTHRIVDPAV